MKLCTLPIKVMKLHSMPDKLPNTAVNTARPSAMYSFII